MQGFALPSTNTRAAEVVALCGPDCVALGFDRGRCVESLLDLPLTFPTTISLALEARAIRPKTCWHAESLILCDSVLRCWKGIVAFIAIYQEERCCSRCVRKCTWAGKRFQWELT